MNYPTPVSPEFYFLFAIIFSALGIFCFFWLIFFLETSRDLSNKDRIIGLFIRLVLFAFTAGTGLLFLNLVGLY
jgi:hypothetical protein